MEGDTGGIAVAGRFFRLDGAVHATIVLKATYALEPDGQMRLARPLPIETATRFWREDPRRSVRLPSDLAPLRPRAEILFTGSAHATAPTGSRQVRLAVYRGAELLVDKVLRVFGDRVAHAADSNPTPATFTAMPLVFERAFGGPTCAENPCGTGHAPNSVGTRVLPNVVYADARGDRVPASYAPIAPSWPTRRSLLRATGDAEVASAMPSLQSGDDSPVPPAFFHDAPEDQRLDAWRAGDRVSLVGLHPEREHYEAVVPRLDAIGRVEAGNVRLATELRLDAIHVLGEERLATLLFRGSVALASAEWAASAPTFVAELLDDGGSHRAMVRVEPPREALSATVDVALPSTTVVLSPIEHELAKEREAVPFDAAELSLRTADEIRRRGTEPVPGAPWTAARHGDANVQRSVAPWAEADPLSTTLNVTHDPRPTAAPAGARVTSAETARVTSAETAPSPIRSGMTPGAQFLAALADATGDGAPRRPG